MCCSNLEAPSCADQEFESDQTQSDSIRRFPWSKWKALMTLSLPRLTQYRNAKRGSPGGLLEFSSLPLPVPSARGDLWNPDVLTRRRRAARFVDPGEVVVKTGRGRFVRDVAAISRGARRAGGTVGNCFYCRGNHSLNLFSPWGFYWVNMLEVAGTDELPVRQARGGDRPTGAPCDGGAKLLTSRHPTPSRPRQEASAPPPPCRVEGSSGP